MTRIVPHPLLTCSLILMWLLLTRFSIGHLLLGTAIAVLAGQAMAALDPVRPRLRRPDLMLRLAGMATADILRSNLAVARVILARVHAEDRRAGFVEIDLELREPTALAVLAVIVTCTPGTVWVDYASARGRLILHVLDLEDPDQWRLLVNDRYGRMLKEIFE